MQTTNSRLAIANKQKNKQASKRWIVTSPRGHHLPLNQSHLGQVANHHQRAPCLGDHVLEDPRLPQCIPSWLPLGWAMTISQAY